MILTPQEILLLALADRGHFQRKTLSASAQEMGGYFFQEERLWLAGIDKLEKLGLVDRGPDLEVVITTRGEAALIEGRKGLEILSRKLQELRF